MIEPKPVTITLQNGTEKDFVLHKFPATAGREIVTQYPISNLPKLAEYQASEAVMLKLMSYVAVVTPDGTNLPLTTKALVDNHVPDWEALGRLEWAMLEYNCSFFAGGLNSDFFKSIGAKAQPLISRILTALSAQSSGADKQHSTN
jgi:hypothetical protein